MFLISNVFHYALAKGVFLQINKAASMLLFRDALSSSDTNISILQFQFVFSSLLSNDLYFALAGKEQISK